jgi:hypothetical protein
MHCSLGWGEYDNLVVSKQTNLSLDKQGCLLQNKKDSAICFNFLPDDTYFQYTTVSLRCCRSHSPLQLDNARIDWLDDVAIHAQRPLVRYTLNRVRRITISPRPEAVFDVC